MHGRTYRYSWIQSKYIQNHMYILKIASPRDNKQYQQTFISQKIDTHLNNLKRYFMHLSVE